MKKSVIFWNIVAAIVILFAYYHFFRFISFIILFVSSMATFVHLMESGCKNSVFDFNKLKKYGFKYWFVYVSPLGLLSLFVHLCYKLVLKFNNWLDSK